MMNLLNQWGNQKNKFERILLLARIEFKLRYYETKIGLFWALLKPVMDIVIYYIAFQVILKSDIPAFASYLFLGLIFWFFFTESTSGTIHILQNKKYLYEYSNMNKLDIYVSTLLSSSIGFVFNTTMFLIYFFIFESTSKQFGFNAIYIIPLFINLFILSLGISLILSTIYISAKDINQIWQVFINFLFFLSPIFYNLKAFRENLPGIDYINPLSGLIINARKTVMYNQLPEWRLFIYDYCYGIALLLIGLLLLNRLGSKAAEKL